MPFVSHPILKSTLSFLFFLLFAAALMTPSASAQSSLGVSSTQSVETHDEVIKPLLDVLKDDEARDKLIKSLEQNAPESEQTSADATDSEAPATVADQLADITKNAINEAVSIGRKFIDDLSGLASLFSGETNANPDELLSLLTPILATVIVALVLYFLSKRAFRAGLGRVSGRLRNRGFFSALALVAMYFLSEVIALAISYFATGAMAVMVFGPVGVSNYQTLFLNAFLVAGITAIIIRTVTGIVDGEYGVLRLSPGIRNSIRRYGIILSRILIYGIAFVVPVAINLVSFTVGRSLRVAIYTVAAIYAVHAIRAISKLQQRAAELPPEEPTEAGDAAVDEALPEPVQSALMHIWPLIGYVYVAVSYVIALSRPALFIDFVGGATLKTVIALVIGGLVLRAVGYLSTLSIRTPKFLPLDSQALSSRLTSFVPLLLRVVWLFVSVAIFAVVVDAWAIFDVSGWIAGERGGAMISGLMSSLIVVIVSFVIWAAASSWIDYRMDSGHRSASHDARYRTLYSLLKNALTVALVVFGGMIALSELGIDIGPLLAGAGVLGLAIGFGAQKLVQDIISGIFIQLENAMNVGDVVGAGGITGVVERLTLRSVSLRDLSGVYHIIPFSSVDSVANYQRIFSYHVAEIGIAYKENVSDGKEAMQEAFDRLLETEHKGDILEPLEMHGVTSLGDSAVLIRARIKTAPGKQFGLGRAYTELVKKVFDERDIEMPFPHTTLFLGRDKEGNTDELPIKLESISPPSDSKDSG